ncbi:caspase family protein [Nocardia nova]|nr:caspase family protein [Nocardia nova]
MTYPDPTNSRAILIGVGTYEHSDRLPHIPAAVHNITDLREHLTGPGAVLASENCWTVADPSSSSHIGDLLDQAAEQASDTLLVYYAGHGLLDSRGRLHLALTSTHPDRTRWSALPFATLREAILDSPAKTRVLILDCCFSGRALEALSDGPDAILGQADIAGTYTITSCPRNETSYAPTGSRNTAFTAALLAAATTTPGLALDDLYAHTRHHLRRHGHPLPQCRAIETAGRLVLFPRTPTAPAPARPPQHEEPHLPDDIQASNLDSAVRRDLRSLDKDNAETVARHLLMVARLIDDDPQLALAHARAARQRAGSIAVVRETAGVAAYHACEWAEALAELHTARRMTGGQRLLAVMADCERGLGRPDRAIELGHSEEARALTGDDAIELRVVLAGARMDLGQYDHAVAMLHTADLDSVPPGPAHVRLFYAYAEALLASGRTEESITWFLNAAAADVEGQTDAADRADELIASKPVDEAHQNAINNEELRHRTNSEAVTRAVQFRQRAQQFEEQAAKAQSAGQTREAMKALEQAKQWREWARAAEL